MRIASGTTDQYIYFVAVDVTDLKTPETGLTTFTVYRSRDGAAAAAYTTPTVNETDATNMPGVYELLLDEDMTIAAGNDNEEIALHISHASMAPVVRVIELYRPKITVGNTLDVTATGAAGIDWGNIENKTTANDLSATDIQLVDTVTTYTGNTVQTGDTYALANGATGFAAIDTVVDGIQTDLSNATDGLGAIKADTAAVLVDTNELQTDWVDGGRLDLILDGASAPTAAAVADAVWDELQADHVIANSFGVVASELATVDANIDAILLDTNELQTDLVDGGRLDLLIDAILADTGTDGVAISATVANQIADAILNRDMTSVSDTNARTLLNAARFLRNKYSVSGTTLTVTKEDDTTATWTSTLTTDAAADPVTGSDPA